MKGFVSSLGLAFIMLVIGGNSLSLPPLSCGTLNLTNIPTTFLTPTCQAMLPAINATLGVGISLGGPVPGVTANPNMNQTLINQFCGTCADGLNALVANLTSTFTATNNTVCLIGSMLVQTLCTVDPISQLGCMNHALNYFIPTHLFEMAFIIAGPFSVGPYGGTCQNISCCETSVANTVNALGIMPNPYKQKLQDLTSSVQSACNSTVAGQCTSMIAPSTGGSGAGAQNNGGLIPAAYQVPVYIAVGVLGGGCLAGAAFFIAKKVKQRTGDTSPLLKF